MILKNLTKDFTTIPNELITDNLSHGAFRLYCYLASKPETWEVNNNDVRKQLKIGSNNSLNKYWKELLETNWIEKKRHKDKKGKFTGKTLLILHNSRNRKKCENGENPLSQKIHYRKNCEIAKSAKHSNTDYISNTDINNNTEEKKEKKEKNNSPLREEKEEETITKTNELKKTNATKKTNNSKPNKTNELQETISLIREFYKENKLSLTGNKVFQYERKIYDLTKSYSLKEIEEVIKFAKRDKYYKKLLTNPTSLFNNFEAMKLALEDEEEPHFKSAFDFYEMNLPKGWML